MVAMNESHPLAVEFAEALFGVGVWERTAMSNLFFVNATWVDPVIT